MKMRPFLNGILAVFTMLLVFSGCAPIKREPSAGIPTPTAIAAVETRAGTATPSQPPLAAQPTATITVAPTRTPWPTSTPWTTWTVTPTALPTGAPTLTPFPSANKNQKIMLVDRLFNTNGGCLLPCWWGIRPGVTPWSETEPYLRSLAVKAPSASEMKAVGTRYYSYDFEDTWLNDTTTQIYWVEGNQIQMIRAMPGKDTNYSMRAIFDRYGKPDEISMIADPREDAGSRPARSIIHIIIMLKYDKYGFLAQYSYAGIVTTDSLSYCVERAERKDEGRPLLMIWPQSWSYSLADIAKTPLSGYLNPNNEFLNESNEKISLPIQDAIGISIEEFQRTLQYNPKPCFFSSVKNWQWGKK